MTAGGFEGVRVLVVEDETLVALLLEDMLADLGCEVVGPAARVSKALQLAADDSVAIDTAILDVNVAGEDVYPVAEALARRGVSFVFATGYGNGGVDELWRGQPVVQKPFRGEEIRRALLATLGGRTRPGRK